MKRIMFETSTGHLPVAEREQLRILVEHHHWTCAYLNVAGFVVWTGYAGSRRCPEQLVQILNHYRCEHDADYVMLDADAEPNPNLEMFE